MESTSQFREIPIAQIQESPDNPRKTVDDAALQELAASIRVRGILAPVIVRPVDGHYELVAGTRRVRAARLIGLDVVPAIVRERPEPDALDDAVTENLQREAVAPLDEARAFARALEQRGQAQTRVEGVVAIADRIGKSPSYVWDRLKLLDLVPDAQHFLEQRRISVQHAVLLARLAPEQQKKAISDGLFEPEESLVLYEDRQEARKTDKWAGYKPKSVRELEAWIANHVRFDVQQAAAAAPLDFGPIAEQVDAAVATPGRGKKVVHITHDSYVKPDARSDERTFCCTSWKLADGSSKKAATCDRSVLGLVVVGPDYGKTFQVCVHKDCDVHWAAERRAREKNRAEFGAGASPAAAAKRREQEEQRRQAEQQREEQQRAAWRKAIPAIATETAKAVQRMKIGTLQELVVRGVNGSDLKEAARLLGAAKSADAILRHLVFARLAQDFHSEYWGPREFPKTAKRYGIDLAAALETATAPAVAKATETKASPTKPTKKGKTGGK